MYNIEAPPTDGNNSGLEIEENSSSNMQQTTKQAAMSSEQKTSGLFDDFDELFDSLTAEEVAELSIVDPDVR